MATRVYKYVMVRVHTGEDVHPFKSILDMDLSISEQRAEEYVQCVVQHVNCSVSTMRDLILVRDVVPSLKLSLVLYAATYIGAWFNGLTVIILLVVGAFTLPKVYEVNERQIDEMVDTIQNKFQDMLKMVQEKVPFLKKKTQ